MMTGVMTPDRAPRSSVPDNPAPNSMPDGSAPDSAVESSARHSAVEGTARPAHPSAARVDAVPASTPPPRGDAPPLPVPATAGVPPLLAVLGVVAGAVASLLRQGGVPAWDSVWAEDGTATLRDAVDGGFWRALSTPVSGYYQTLPRLLAEPVAQVPATWAAGAFAVEAALVTSLFALFVYVASGEHLRTPVARLAAASVAVLVPVGMQDVPNSLCNLHWAGMYAVCWALLYTPRGTAGRVASLAVVLLMAVTNILVAVFLPLALLRVVVHRRRRYTWIVGFGLLLGLVPQGIGLLTGAAATREMSSHPLPRAAFDGFFSGVVPRAFLGEVLAPRSPTGPLAAWLLPTCVWAGVAVAVLVAVRHADPNWPVVAVLVAHALLFWMVAAGGTGLFTARYEVTPAMLLVAATAALLRPGRVAGSRSAPGPWSVPLLAFVLLLTVVWTVGYRVPNERAAGPRWSTAVAQARATCHHPGVTAAVLRIAPTADPRWTVPLSCRYLLQRQHLPAWLP